MGKNSIPEENGVNLPTRKRIKKGEQYSIVLSLDKYLLLYSFFRCANDIYKYIYIYVPF